MRGGRSDVTLAADLGTFEESSQVFQRNAIRILGLVLLTLGLGDWVIDSPIHPASGVAAFALALSVLFLVSSRMDNRPILSPSAPR